MASVATCLGEDMTSTCSGLESFTKGKDESNIYKAESKASHSSEVLLTASSCMSIRVKMSKKRKRTGAGVEPAPVGSP